MENVDKDIFQDGVRIMHGSQMKSPKGKIRQNTRVGTVCACARARKSIRSARGCSSMLHERRARTNVIPRPSLLSGGGVGRAAAHDAP